MGNMPWKVVAPFGGPFAVTRGVEKDWNQLL